VQGSKEGKEELAARLSNGPRPVEASREAPYTTPQQAERPKVFVVHGHDVQAREQLELILHRLGLEPFVLANTGGGGLTLIEALEQELKAPANRPHFGIVLMTPDDTGYAREQGELGSQSHLPAQNVV
jgi:predicted nucleotide-binding protein